MLFDLYIKFNEQIDQDGVGGHGAQGRVGPAPNTYSRGGLKEKKSCCSKTVRKGAQASAQKET